MNTALRGLVDSHNELAAALVSPITVSTVRTSTHKFLRTVSVSYLFYRYFSTSCCY